MAEGLWSTATLYYSVHSTAIALRNTHAHMPTWNHPSRDPQGRDASFSAAWTGAMGLFLGQCGS